MMDVDQPVSSTTEAESSSEVSQENAPTKSPGMIVRECDDLPALLISDSDEDEPPKASTEEKKTDDISGISPIENTVANANDKCDDTGNETTVCSTLTTQKTSVLSTVVGEDISLVENIDLTGVSSADDSGVNERSEERTATPPVVKTPTPAKPSSEMTAQELLESLLEAQEEAFASQRASSNMESLNNLAETNLPSKQPGNASDMEKITNSKIDCTSGELAKETINEDTVVPGEGSSKMDAVVVDDECLLEEMDNGSGGQQEEMDIDEHHTGTNSPCSDDGSGETGDDALECAEPPKKRARSMTSDPENSIQLSEAKASESNEKPSAEHTKHEKHLSVVQPEPAPEYDDKSKSVAMVGSENNIHTIGTSVCPVLVIDDDEDDVEVSKIKDTIEKKIDVTQENNLPMDKKNLPTDQSGDTSVKGADIDIKSPAGRMESKLMAMEFLQRFNKPITKMTRSDLEQLVLQKIAESFVHHSENAELRKIIKKQSAKLQGYERTISDMNTHFEGLKLVSERAVEDMKKRANSFIAPVKITRAVGLQVSRPAMEMPHSNKPSNFLRTVPEKRKNLPATATVSTNGAIENRAESSKPNEIANKSTQQAVPFVGGQQNASANLMRSQLSNNAAPMGTTRSPNSSMSNGMIRTPNSQVGKHSSSITTTNVNTTSGNAVRLVAVHSNDSPGASIASPAAFASASPNTSSGANSIAGGIESPVRKKFHKFTPKRPPLSPYQQAQQEKQVRQHQELLVQQIHEQSQQAQRKAQMNVRSDLVTLEKNASRAAIDAVARQRPLTQQQSRQMNANVLLPNVSQSCQIVPFGGTRATTAMPNSTTMQLSEVKTNSSLSTSSSAPTNDSLIDLTDEDDTTAKEGGIHATAPVKRMKFSHSDSFTSTPPRSANPATSSTAPGGIQQLNNAVVRAPLNVNRSNNGLQPFRHPIYNSNMPRLPAASIDAPRKRVVTKPLLAPLPLPGPQPSNSSWKLPPPQPSICVNNVQAGIVISWTMQSLTDRHADIETYQIYAYQELSIPTSPEEWRHVGDVKALLLPMAVTLTQFHEGQRYYFAVRAIDVHKRVGKFCDPRTWNETNVSNV